MIDLDPVFNDLSCKPLASDKYEASKRMAEFIRLLNEFPAYGLGKSLRTTGDFYGLDLSAGYSVSDWMFDPESPQVERELFTTLATKSPILVELDSTIAEVAGNSEASCDQGVSEALLVSYLVELPLIALNHNLWSEPHFDCIISEINDEGEIEETEHTLVNFAKPDHFKIHHQWLEDRLTANLHSLSDAWTERAKQFPHLYFAKEVKAQLLNISSGSDLAAQVMSRLFDLERVASLGKAFNASAFRTTCSPSSTTALDKFESDYSFQDDTGHVHLCGWHLKMLDGNRIYFADLGDRYLVGHIGKHLPTKKFN